MISIDFLKTILPILFRGLKLTIFIAVVGIFFGFIIGCLSGYALQTKNKFIKMIAEIYIWIIRGTPIVVQALYVYFVLPKLIGIDFSSTLAGCIVICLNSGAFISEIVRGALESIDYGQKEAGVSLGLTNTQVLFHVIVPPAFRLMLPALFNQFIISVKDTSLLSIIVVNETTHEAQAYAALSFRTIETYTTLALFYLILISILILLQKYIEKRLKTK
jgi:glutamine transport system permease protein